MYTLRIDVSKSRSKAAVLEPFGKTVPPILPRTA